MLPLVFGRNCRPGVTRADVVLAIDTSDSMVGAKLAAAKAAAVTFIDLLDLGADQAAVIGFDAAARTAAQLTTNQAALEQAILGLRTGHGTMIDRALRAAIEELVSPRHAAGHRRVIVLLSDGAHGGAAGDVLAVAAAARTAGMVVYAIGLGADADAALLAAVSGPERYYHAPTAAELETIYRQIAQVIPCP
jgi:Mg-chelatase subunit ChlD